MRLIETADVTPAAASAGPSLAHRARSAAVTAGITGLTATLTPIWMAHHGATRLATRRRQGSTTELPRVAAEDITVDGLLSEGRPVVVEGLADRLGVGGAATEDALRAAIGETEVTVSFHDAARPYFLYSGGYDAQLVERRTMPVGELLDLVLGGRVPEGCVIYQLFGPRAVDGHIAEQLDAFDRAIAPHTSHRTEPRFSGVWIGSTGVVTPLHHDAWPGLLFQTHGHKRAAIYAPRDRTNLYFRAPVRGEGRWSTLPGRSADADPAQYPLLAHTVRHETVLGPGDAMYIPPFWAHEMEAVEGNISVPFRFATFARDRLNPGFLRPSAELLRKRLAS